MALTTTSELEEFLSANEGRTIVDVEVFNGARLIAAF